MFQRVEDLFCQSVRYPRYLRNFFYTGFLQTLQTTHIFQQHLSAFRTNAVDRFKTTGTFHFCPYLAVPRDSMIVRLIANVLDNM